MSLEDIYALLCRELFCILVKPEILKARLFLGIRAPISGKYPSSLKIFVKEKFHIKFELSGAVLIHSFSCPFGIIIYLIPSTPPDPI